MNTYYTSRLVLHLNSSSVNHTVYLNYGFMATSESQKYVINRYFGIVKNVIGIDSIPYSTTNTGIPHNSTTSLVIFTV